MRLVYDDASGFLEATVGLQGQFEAKIRRGKIAASKSRQGWRGGNKAWKVQTRCGFAAYGVRKEWGSVIGQDKPIFVLSDLHLGDGSSRDTFARGNREVQLHRFLDYVEAEGGDVVINGDLLEMLWWDTEAIVERYECLLDRLYETGAVYLPGNHDAGVVDFCDGDGGFHPIFGNVRRSLLRTVGDKTFKFMHGHEADPFSGRSLARWGQMFENLPEKCESRNGRGMLSNDRFCEFLGEMSGQALKAWRWVTSGISWSLSECERMRLACEIKEIGRTMRTRRMVKRYSEELNQGHYDIAIVGHTHRPGEFGSWYFNSGSWTGLTNNFIRISPWGQAQVFDWVGNSPSVISDG